MTNKKTDVFLNYLKIFIGALLIASIVFYVYHNRKSVETVYGEKPLTIKVFPQLENQLGDVRRIKITHTKGAIQLIRQGNEWIMPERSGFKVSKSYLESFTNAMLNLRQGDLVTSDPAKFDSLQVGEPVEFGRGNIVEFFDAQDQLIAGSHIGQVGDAAYVRVLGENQVYNASPISIDMTDVSQWLELDFLNVSPENIVATSLTTPMGHKFDIIRNATGDFKANERTSEKSGINITRAAILISKIKFKDVAPATRISSPPKASEIVTLKNGEKIEIRLIEQYHLYWVKIKALSNSEFANEINKNADGWAFEIDKSIADDFVVK